jgi:hypothetical protein
MHTTTSFRDHTIFLYPNITSVGPHRERSHKSVTSIQSEKYYHASLTMQRTFIYSSMSVGPSPLHQFRNLFNTDSKTPWRGDQPIARPLLTHRTTQTQNKRIHRHTSSGFERTIPAFEWTKTVHALGRGHCDRKCTPNKPIYKRSLENVAIEFG